MSTNSNGTPATAPASVGADLEQIRAVVDHLPHLAWSCRPDGHCEYLSRRWVEYTGVPETEHHGTGWLSAVHPDDRERTRAGWEAFVAGAGEYDVDYRLRRRDGAYRWFKTRGVLATAAGGRPARVFGTTTDIDDPPCSTPFLGFASLAHTPGSRRRGPGRGDDNRDMR